MYAEYYGLRELPFNITPDPRFLYLNDTYQEALAALAYGIDARKGFITLIGEAGTGKTTMLRRLLDTLDPRTRTVLLLNPTVSFDEILQHILAELGIPSDGGGKLMLLQRLNEFLLEHTSAGGNVVLLIDEAQDLNTGALEELRLLSNLETAREKILQIVLTGQPELETILRNPVLRQLRQRVALHVRVRPLSPGDVAAYVRTRLQHAGATDLDLFTPDALERVAVLSRGIPRLVNVLCDAALLTAFVAESRPVTAALVDAAWSDYGDDAPLVEPEPTVVQPPELRRVVPPPPPAPEPPRVPLRPPVEPELPTMVAAAAAAADTAAAMTAPVVASARPEAPRVAAVTPVATPTTLLSNRFAPQPAAFAPAPAPVAAPSPTPSASVVRPAPASTLSVPTAAALVALIAVGVYGISLDRDRYQTDDRDVAEAVQVAPPAAAAPVAAAPAEAVAAPPPADPAPVASRPISAAEATELIEQFRTAYEARDVDRLLGLFAADATENGRHGLDVIANAYRVALGGLEDVRYTLPSVAVAAGTHADVRAPFVISYRQPSGDRGEIRGDAEWALERRNGQARIVSLSYRLEPQG